MVCELCRMPRSTPPDSSHAFDEEPIVPTFELELIARRAGHLARVAGADEAGRGPPGRPWIVAAAVILDPERIPDGLNRSKQLSAASARRCLSKSSRPPRSSIASSSAARIDITDIREPRASTPCARAMFAALPCRQVTY